MLGSAFSCANEARERAVLDLRFAMCYHRTRALFLWWSGLTFAGTFLANMANTIAYAFLYAAETRTYRLGDVKEIRRWENRTAGSAIQKVFFKGRVGGVFGDK